MNLEPMRKEKRERKEEWGKETTSHNQDLALPVFLLCDPQQIDF